MRQNFLVIHNPTSGRRRRRFVDQTVEALEKAGAEVERYATTGPADATRFLLEQTIRWQAVVAAGGDGTVNEVANGLRQSNGATLSCPLGVIPVGTANVLARELSLPSSPDRIASTLLSAPAQPVYTSRVNDQRFLLMVGAGFDAQVVHGVDLQLKRRVGKAAYVLAALAALPRWGASRYTLDVDGTVYETASAIVSHGRLYGGSFVLAPEASLGKRELAVVLFDAPSRRSFVGSAFAFARNRLASSRHVRVVTGQRVEIRGEENEPLQIDGDAAGLLPAVIEMEEEPLWVVAPAGR